MVAQHREHDGQRQIVVVNRPLLGDLAVNWIRFFAGQQGGNDLALARNDNDQNIGGHDRTNQGTNLDECATAAKHMCIAIRSGHKQHEAGDRQTPRGAPEPGSAQQIVDEPADNQRRGRAGNRIRDVDIHHRRVDQINRGV